MNNDIKAVPALLLAWLLSGFGAVAGSMLGNAFGRAGLFAGAVIGGAVASVLAVIIATTARWLPRELRMGAMGGGLLGFLVAAPIAVANLHTPITPIAVTSLTGIGALLGAGVARGRRGR